LSLYTLSASAQNRSWDNDTALEFYWAPAAGNVDHYKGYVFEFLFAIDASYESELDSGVISAGLRAAFIDHNITLSDVATVSKRWDNAWQIVDGASTYDIRPTKDDGQTLWLDVISFLLAFETPDATAPTEQDPLALPFAAVHGKTYRLEVEALNNVGASGPMSDPSNRATVDLTPPTMPVVSDDGDVTATATHFHITWPECGDAESGILGYQYCVGTTSGGTDVQDWVSVGLATEVFAGITLSLGGTYYGGVRAINGAGTPSAVGVTDGIQIVLPAPGRPVRP